MNHYRLCSYVEEFLLTPSAANPSTSASTPWYTKATASVPGTVPKSRRPPCSRRNQFTSDAPVTGLRVRPMFSRSSRLRRKNSEKSRQNRSAGPRGTLAPCWPSCPDCQAGRRTKCQDSSGYLPRARRFPCPARVDHAANVDALKRRGVWDPTIPADVHKPASSIHQPWAWAILTRARTWRTALLPAR
jgi:hypothetical protein